MNIVDANVLLCAVNEQSDRHAESKHWLDWALSGGSVVGFSWLVLLAFVRLGTKPHLFPAPLTVDDRAVGSISSGICCGSAGVGGNLVNDAHRAALAIEHRGQFVSCDSDFGGFAGVRWSVPTVRA